ncbi:hypothetical protein Y032_0214g2328 [Ancylostoma ceylanicum]|uniref:Uncharacterized protein n=1 Tax=Ancylostoma ceylanicum TaxID=53326 RepID=A0A016SK84_9BILA|nr:hypothetical protein Y032_0214g2328 [Ancylostoma ceylanicum]
MDDYSRKGRVAQWRSWSLALTDRWFDLGIESRPTCGFLERYPLSDLGKISRGRAQTGEGEDQQNLIALR